MDRDALRYALKMVSWYVLLSAGGGFALWAAVWGPTWVLMHLGGWPFLDAYMTGPPFGILGLCIIAIGVMSYRHRRREAPSPTPET